MKKAFAHTAEFDALIAQTLATISVRRTRFVRDSGDDRPPASSRARDAALRREPAPEGRVERRCRTGAGRLAGAPGQGAVLHEPARSGRGAAHRARVHRAGGVVIKHTNPCGVATGPTLAAAYVARARRRPAVGLRRHRRAESPDRCRRPRRRSPPRSSRRSLRRRSRTTRARSSPRKTNMRVVTADFESRARAWAPRDSRSILGGMLTQDADQVTEARDRGHRTPRPWRPSAIGRGEAAHRDPRRHETPADGGRVDGAALRLARVRARQVEHRDLHHGEPHARRSAPDR